MGRGESVTLEIEGHQVPVSNPAKLFFPDAGVTKLDLVNYYLAVAEGAAARRAGSADGAEALSEWRGRRVLLPEARPCLAARLRDDGGACLSLGRTADEVVVSNAAALSWVVNLGCIDLNPHPVRSSDLDHPDELRVDLDPGPGVPWADVRSVALVVAEVLTDHGIVGWPKTSGSRGIHVYARLEPRWGFSDVRRAALALAREVERRAPAIATSKWWKEERHGVFIDYNQNAKDRTVASAYSVRPVPDARVSAPLLWSEVPDAELADFTSDRWPRDSRKLGDVGAGIDDDAASLEPLLELSARQEAQGLGDAPWPPHYAKQEGEPPRVQPSKRRTDSRPRTDPRPPTDPSAPRGRVGSVPPSMPQASRRNPDGTVSPTGRRRSAHPLLVVAQAAAKEDAMAGLDRWRSRHPAAAAHLAVDDVLVDAMRGRFTMWWRVRVNLRHVPEGDRPAAEPPDPDYDPWAGESPPGR